MKKTKRWLLMCAALVGLMAHAGALRATSLIFAKSTTTTTTTTTTTEAPVSEGEMEDDNNTSTPKSTLTGIPQIDYIWDPNLPRELNGYNLSEYPFFGTVPPLEEIDFKCDGLHDGFYASVQHKCQVYHHCLYGVRADFLCANYTAFDQRTFICHFVSQVDCKNSPKYWHRNDALYMPTTSTTTTTQAPATTTSTARPRPNRPRRPFRRRRPQDYYYDDEYYDDDYYEERVNRRRKNRPRTRRPEYDDDYEERRGYSEEDRYEKRPNSRDRDRPRDADIEDEDAPYDRRKPERERPRSRKPGRVPDEEKPEIKKPKRPGYTGDRRFNSEERRSFIEDRDRKKPPPVVDDDEPTSDRRPLAGRRRPNGGRRPSSFSDDYDRPYRRDEFEDDRAGDDPKEEKTLVRPTGSGTSSLSSLFDRPRAPPKISRPVPVNERKKFEYTSSSKNASPSTSTTTTTTTTTSTSTSTARPVEPEPEYYDEEEYEELPAPKEKEPPRRPQSQEDREPPRKSYNDYIPRRPSSYEERRPVTEKVSYNPRTEDDPVPPRNKLENDSPAEKTPFRFRSKDDDRTTRPRPFEDEKPRSRPDDSLPERPSYRPKQQPEDDRSDKTPYRMRPFSSIVNRDEKNRSSKPSRDPIYESEEDYEDQAKDYRQRTHDNSRRVNTSKEWEESPSTADADLSDPKDQLTESKNAETDERIHLPVALDISSEDTAEQEPDEKPQHSAEEEQEPEREARPIVRVVKRPFLPSRGGSPYLPRGLQAVGGGQKQAVTESTPVDMGSTISGVRLLEHGAPIVRGSTPDSREYPEPHQGPRTTQPPKVEPPKINLDELYENEYDVTLNDALNPTLKPLTSRNQFYPSGFTSGSGRSQLAQSRPNYSDSYYSATLQDVRRSAAVQPAPANGRTAPASGVSRIAAHFYDEYEY